MAVIILWIFFSIVSSQIASEKGRTGINYFFLSLFLSPVIGIIAALVSRPNTEKLDLMAVKKGTHKHCPYCREVVKIKATACKHCGKDFVNEESSQGI